MRHPVGQFPHWIRRGLAIHRYRRHGHNTWRDHVLRIVSEASVLHGDRGLNLWIRRRSQRLVEHPKLPG